MRHVACFVKVVFLVNQKTFLFFLQNGNHVKCRPHTSLELQGRWDVCKEQMVVVVTSVLQCAVVDLLHGLISLHCLLPQSVAPGQGLQQPYTGRRSTRVLRRQRHQR